MLARPEEGQSPSRLSTLLRSRLVISSPNIQRQNSEETFKKALIILCWLGELPILSYKLSNIVLSYSKYHHNPTILKNTVN